MPFSKRQGGIYTVEFAICGAVYFIALFGVIEVARLLFTLNVLDEVTRRGARMASVCPISSSANVIDHAIMNGRIINGLKPEHLSIAYLENDVTTETTETSDTAYIRVNIAGYTHQLLIPFIFTDISVPTFSTTVLAESLGVVPVIDSAPTIKPC